MGKIYSGFPQPLANFFITDFKVTNFVETGTYLGSTAEWASTYFKNVYTIEASRDLFDSTSRRLNHLRNIKFYRGESGYELKKIVPSIQKGGTLFWLDAHWSGGNTFGDEDECPVLRELKVINANNKSNSEVIIIDDASLFLTPPPLPHNPDKWPSIAELMTDLKPKERYIVIWRDVVIAVPKKIRRKLIDYIGKVENSRESKKTLKERFFSKIIDKFTLLVIC